MPRGKVPAPYKLDAAAFFRLLSRAPGAIITHTASGSRRAILYANGGGCNGCLHRQYFCPQRGYGLPATTYHGAAVGHVSAPRTLCGGGLSGRTVRGGGVAPRLGLPDGGARQMRRRRGAVPDCVRGRRTPRAADATLFRGLVRTRRGRHGPERRRHRRRNISMRGALRVAVAGGILSHRRAAPRQRETVPCARMRRRARRGVDRPTGQRQHAFGRRSARTCTLAGSPRAAVPADAGGVHDA